MASESVPPNLAQGLVELVEAFDQYGLKYAVIGGIAASFHSRPRFTRDLDFILEIPQLKLPAVLKNLQDRGFTLDQLKVIREWTQNHITVLDFHAVRIDWLKPIIPCYQHVLDRARAEDVLGHSIRIATAEGVILTKLIPLRSQDVVDIENLLAANQGKLDLDWIRQEWETVADLNDPRLQKFNDLVAQFYLPSPEAQGASSPAN